MISLMDAHTQLQDRAGCCCAQSLHSSQPPAASCCVRLRGCCWGHSSAECARCASRGCCDWCHAHSMDGLCVNPVVGCAPHSVHVSCDVLSAVCSDVCAQQQMPVCKGLFALVLLNGVAFTGALRGLLQLPVQIAALMLHPLAMTSATSPQLGCFSILLLLPSSPPHRLLNAQPCLTASLAALTTHLLLAGYLCAVLTTTMCKHP